MTRSGLGGWWRRACTDLFPHFFLFFSQRSARLIPEDDQIFTEVELNMLDKVINETTVNVPTTFYKMTVFL